jgi:hypothetical protein
MTQITQGQNASEKTESAQQKPPQTQAKVGKKRPVAAKPPRKSKAQRTTKAASMLALLQRKAGASIPELMQASGWQAHSVRGFLSGQVNKREDLTLTSEVTEIGRRYRIESSAKGKG